MQAVMDTTIKTLTPFVARFFAKKYFLQFYHKGRTIIIEKNPQAQWEKGLVGFEGFYLINLIVQLNIDCCNKFFEPSPLNIEKAVGK